MKYTRHQVRFDMMNIDTYHIIYVPHTIPIVAYHLERPRFIRDLLQCKCLVPYRI